VKLDRNINPDGLGKYRLWNERRQAWDDDCAPGEPSEFFVIKLKDRHARAALLAYAASVEARGDFEYEREIIDLANRAGTCSPFCKDPD
jgi:hypothetical protein